MSRALQWINLGGVVGLAVLSAVQWQVNRKLNHQVQTLEVARVDQDQKLQQKEKALAGCAADLDTFREQVVQLSKSSKAAAGTNSKREEELAQMASERDQLKEAVIKWKEAVDLRDAEIKTANARIMEAVEQRNEVAEKLNSLVGKYDGLVKELNERTQKYNELVGELNKSSAKK